MLHTAQSVSLQTQVHGESCSAGARPLQSLGDRRNGTGWFSLFHDACARLEKFVLTVSVAQTISCETRSCKNKLLLKKRRFLCLRLRTHHVVLRPPRNLWLGCPQTNHTCQLSPPWSACHPAIRESQGVRIHFPHHRQKHCDTVILIIPTKLYVNSTLSLAPSGKQTAINTFLLSRKLKEEGWK